jgi:hypothetical protein
MRADLPQPTRGPCSRGVRSGGGIFDRGDGESPANPKKPTPGLEPGTPSLRVKRVCLTDFAISLQMRKWCETAESVEVHRSPQKSTALQRCVPTVFQSELRISRAPASASWRRRDPPQRRVLISAAIVKLPQLVKGQLSMTASREFSSSSKASCGCRTDRRRPRVAP